MEEGRVAGATGRKKYDASAVLARNRTLDCVRIVLAALVAVQHSYDLTGFPEREPLRRIGVSFGLGGVAVTGFFLLSGWLIVASWDKDPDLGDFLKKRALRIFPGWAVAVIVSVVMAGWLAPAIPYYFRAMEQAPWRWPFVLSVLRLDSLAAPPAFPGQSPAVNGSLWTLGYEVRAYLAVAVLGALGCVRRRGAWLAATGTVALLDLEIKHVLGHGAVWTLWEWGLVEPSRTAMLFTAFFVGGCYYLFRDKVRFRPIYAAAALLLLLLATRWQDMPALVMDGAGGYLLFYLGEAVSIPNRGWVRHMPDISYGMYIYGFPLQQFLIWYLHPSIAVLIWLSVAGGAVLGALSWYGVERPMLRLKPHPMTELPS